MHAFILIADALLDTALGNEQSSVCVSVNVCLKHNNITRSYGVNPSGVFSRCFYTHSIYNEFMTEYIG